MKKASSILLVITLISVLAACSNADDNIAQAESEAPPPVLETEETPSPTPSPTPEVDEFVGWRVANNADDFYALLSEKILDYANYMTAFSDAYVGIYTDVAMGKI